MSPALTAALVLNGTALVGSGALGLWMVVETVRGPVTPRQVTTMRRAIFVFGTACVLGCLAMALAAVRGET